MTSVTPQNSSAISQPPFTIPAKAMPLISPSALLQAHLTQNPPIRPSGRLPLQFRPIDLNISALTHCNGSSVVKIGNTTIVCGVRAEILPVADIPNWNTKPALYADQQQQQRSQQTETAQIEEEKEENYENIRNYNLVVPNLELQTGCSPLHTSSTSPPTQQAQSLTQRLYTTILTSHLIRPSDLEIIYTPPSSRDETSTTDLDPDDPGYVETRPEIKAFWVLYIDLVCVSFGGEGGVFDGAVLAIYAALRDVLLPSATWDVDLGGVVCSSRIEEGWKLKLGGCPVSVGFGWFVLDLNFGGVAGGNGNGNGNESEGMLLIDIDSFEEESCSETGCVVVDVDPHTRKVEIVRVEKKGGGFVGVSQIKSVVECAEKRWWDWKEVLDRTFGI